METQLSIRPATIEDVPAMTALLGMLFELERDFTPNVDLQGVGLSMLIQAPELCCVLVAATAGQVVGMCTAQALISTAEGGRAALVEDLVVSPAYRRLGAATALLAQIGSWASSRGIGRLQLLADKGNTAALDFYRKRSWQSTELICLRRRLDSFGHIPGGPHDS